MPALSSGGLKGRGDMKSERKDPLKLESQDDIAYLTGKRSPEEQKKQIKMPRYSLRCPSCGRFVPAGAVRCQHCGAKL